MYNCTQCTVLSRLYLSLHFIKIIQYTHSTLHPSPASCPLQMFIPRSSLSYVFAITGGVFYASKFPENMFPGSATVALPCDCHMTTSGCMWLSHDHDRSMWYCTETSIPLAIGLSLKRVCCLLCWLLPVLSTLTSCPSPRQGELLWL